MRTTLTTIRRFLTEPTLHLFLLLGICSTPSLSTAQQGWYEIKTPFAITDFDALNDSVIAAYHLSGLTQESFDGGETWIVRANAVREPVDSFSRYQIKVISLSDLRIIGAIDRSGVYHGGASFGEYIADSRDSGGTWAASVGSGLNFYGYGLIRHTVARWFFRDFVPIQPAFLAPRVWSGKTGNLVWSNDTFHAPELDLLDSVGVAAVFKSTTPSIWRTANGGAHWDSVPNVVINFKNSFGPVQAVSPSVWCVAVDSNLLRSVDSGITWQTSKHVQNTISDLGFFDSVGYIVPYGADYIEKSTDGGATWFAQSTGNNSMYFVIPTGPKTAYLSGYTSTIMHLSDGGDRGPVLSISRTLDFGYLPPDSVRTISVVGRNVGIDTLRIAGYTIDNNMIVGIAPDTFALAPGDSITLTISGIVGQHSHDTAHVELHTNSVPQDQNIEIRARSNDTLSSVALASQVQPVNLRLSKNPWTESSTLSIESPLPGAARVHIWDLLGREWNDRVSSTRTLTFVASDLPSGFFTIEVQIGRSNPERISMIHR